jgi:NAD(P)-dependent dehydrogenase (short-subunit alcohol dehydrogenase family)
VQGASRGLGLEFARQLLQRQGQEVVATCRRPDEAGELKELQQQSGSRLHLVQLDCTSEASIERAAEEVSQLCSHLDLLLNVAGILHNAEGLAPGDAWAAGDVGPALRP